MRSILKNKINTSEENSQHERRRHPFIQTIELRAKTHATVVVNKKFQKANGGK